MSRSNGRSKLTHVCHLQTAPSPRLGIFPTLTWMAPSRATRVFTPVSRLGAGLLSVCRGPVRPELPSVSTLNNTAAILQPTMWMPRTSSSPRSKWQRSF